MKISKFLISTLFVLGILINTIDLNAMLPAGGSRRYRDFLEELNKPKPNSSTLSDWYYEIESSDEQNSALKAATQKGISISGQEEEQRKIKAQILKDIKAEQEKRLPKDERKSDKEEKMDLAQFEKLLKIGAIQSVLEKSFNQLDSSLRDKALERATYYGVTIPGYKKKQRNYTVTQVTQIQDEILKKEAELSGLISQNRESKNVLDDRLTLSEQLQGIKEDIKKTKQSVDANESEISKLNTTSDVKQSRVVGLLKSQNLQLKNQNKDLKEQISKLEQQLQSLKIEKK